MQRADANWHYCYVLPVTLRYVFPLSFKRRITCFQAQLRCLSGNPDPSRATLPILYKDRKYITFVFLSKLNLLTSVPSCPVPGQYRSPVLGLGGTVLPLTSRVIRTQPKHVTLSDFYSFARDPEHARFWLSVYKSWISSCCWKQMCVISSW